MTRLHCHLGGAAFGLLLSVTTQSLVAQAPLPWSDDFESYPHNTSLNGVNGWQGWMNDPTFVASTTTSPPGSLPNSALRIEGINDTVVPFSPATTGEWAVDFWQYIPSGLTGTTYLIMHNQYDDACATCNWSLQVKFDGASGLMTDDGASGASQAFLPDQWVNIRIEIDLDSDTQRFLYNGIQFYTGTWSGHVSGGGITELGSINLFANGATVVYYDDFSVTQIPPVPPPTLPWSDDFQSYADNTQLDGVNGWQGWMDNPAFAAFTTISPPAPLPNSALRIEGVNDTVVPFSPASSGEWVVEFRQYIPSSLTGTSYFIMHNQYDDACATCNWSLQVKFDGASGLMTDDGASGASQAFLPDQWVNIRIEIDLDSDTQRFLYNGIQFYTGTWSGHVSGGGITELGSINLFANGATVVYYDDFSITQEPENPLPWADDFESYAHNTHLDGVNGWQGWGNSSVFAAFSTMSPPAPLPNSAVLIAGGNDAVVPFDSPTSGTWLVEFRQYIPSGLSGTSYFIMLNQYDDACAACNWSVQVQFDGTTGLMTDDGAGGASQAFLTDQWIDVNIEIDLDSDVQRLFYNGGEFYTGNWTGHVSGGGVAEIGALSLFANGASAIYYDDFSISQVVLPVELTSFDALADGDEIVLHWTTATETNNAGFSIEHELVGGTFGEIGWLEGQGTTDQPQEYRFVVRDAGPGVHRFRLKQVDFDGGFEYTPVVEVLLAVPDQFVIESAYPNPFNRTTSLGFAIAVDRHVKVSLVNALGQVVRTLFDGPARANQMQRLTVDADGLPSGVYLVRLDGDGIAATERLVLAR